MKFGSPVWVRRGGNCEDATPGCRRIVPGVLLGARGHQRLVRLTQDDPLDTVGWNKAGDVGHWSASAVSPRETERER